MAKGTITPSAIAVNNIQTLPDVVVGQAGSLKALFDKSDLDQQDYINNTLIPELNGNDGSKKIGHSSLNISADNVNEAIEEVNAKDASNVKLTGNQTVDGTKTFSSSPIVPTPTQQTHASNKQYVDDTVAGVVVGIIPDGSITDIKLSNASGQIKERVSDLETEILTKAEQSEVDLKAPINSPTFTGTPTAPTATFGTNTTQLATTEFVQSGLSPKFEQANYGNISTRSASWTLELTDANDVITVSAAAVITVPLSSTVDFPVGTAITFIRTGAGAVTFAPASSVTLLSKDTKRAIDGQYASATLIKAATDTWHLFGALA